MAPTKEKGQKQKKKNIEESDVAQAKEKQKLAKRIVEGSDVAQPKEKKKKKEAMPKNEHDPMGVTIVRCSTVWQGKRTKDILVPQLRPPKIHVSIDNDETMIFAYDSKMRNVTCGRNLKQMLPQDVYDFLLEDLSKNYGMLYDGRRYFIRTTSSLTMFQLGIQKVIDHQRYVLKNKQFKLAFLSSGQSKYLSSFWEDFLKKNEFLTAYIVTGRQTNTYVDPGGMVSVNKLGITKIHKKTFKGERGGIDYYDSIMDLEVINEKRIRRLKTKSFENRLRKKHRDKFKLVKSPDQEIMATSQRSIRKTARRILSSDEEGGSLTDPEVDDADKMEEDDVDKAQEPSGSEKEAETEKDEAGKTNDKSGSEEQAEEAEKNNEEPFTSFRETEEEIESPADFSENSVKHLDYLIEKAASLHNFVITAVPDEYADNRVAKKAFSMVFHIVDLMRKLYLFFGDPIPRALLDPTALLQARDQCRTPGPTPYTYAYIEEMLDLVLRESPIEREKIIAILDSKIARLEFEPKDLRVDPRSGYLLPPGISTSPERGSPLFNDSLVYGDSSSSTDEIEFSETYVPSPTCKKQKVNIDPAELIDPVTGYIPKKIVKESLRKLRPTSLRKRKIMKLRDKDDTVTEEDLNTFLRDPSQDPVEGEASSSE